MDIKVTRIRLGKDGTDKQGVFHPPVEGKKLWFVEEDGPKRRVDWLLWAKGRKEVREEVKQNFPAVQSITFGD